MIEKFDLKLPFKEYLKVDALSYSKLSRTADIGYQIIHDNDEEISITKNFIARDLGSIVDDLLHDPENIDSYLVTDINPPTASTLQLANEIIKYCEANQINYQKLEKLNKNYEIALKFTKDLQLWSRSSDEVIVETKLKNEELWGYIKNKLSVLVDNKTLIYPNQWEKANELVDVLKNHRFTSSIFNNENCINQFSYTFTINGLTYKIRIDKLLVDTKYRVLKPYDLKTGDVPALQFGKNFYNNHYYLQGSLYYLGLLHLITTNALDYTIDNFKFIYISTKEKNPYPLIYTMSDEWIELGYQGFESKTGKRYKGVKELSEEYLYYFENKPNLPKEVIESDGELIIPLP